MTDTRSENEDAPGNKPVGVLTYILRYDDLLATVATAMPPLGRDIFSIELRRREDDAEPHPETFFLPDPFVSSRHARIERRGIVDVIQDLSKHGTYIHGKPLDKGVQHKLCDGDLIEAGHSLLVYRQISAQLVVESNDAVLLGPTRTLSPETMHLSRELARIAPTMQSVLFLGERGAGKEIAARHLHERSGRTGPFVAIDCGAIPETLLESELFGNVPGAYSEARGRKGRIRSGHKGTVFLDEIGNLSESAQARLLRVVHEREVVPLGSDEGQKVDVRWIAATNADLFAEGARFRCDLRDRLAGHVARLPPLRRRREDLGILTAHILKQAGVRKAAISKRAGRMLFGSALAGNIRELENTLRSAVALAGDGPIDTMHLPSAELPVAVPDEIQRGRVLPSGRSECPSRETILDALDKADWVQQRASQILRTNERQLRRWMDMAGIPRAKSRT